MREESYYIHNVMNDKTFVRSALHDGVCGQPYVTACEVTQPYMTGCHCGQPYVMGHNKFILKIRIMMICDP